MILRPCAPNKQFESDVCRPGPGLRFEDPANSARPANAAQLRRYAATGERAAELRRMKVADVIRMLQTDGWILVATQWEPSPDQAPIQVGPSNGSGQIER
jgi:hypothetical protein